MSETQTISVEERIDQLEARGAIRELLADYAHGCDRHQADRFIRIWHEDAVWNVGGAFGTATGAEEIEKVLNDIWTASPETHHWITDVTVRFTGPDSAEGDAHTICYVRNAEDDELFVSCDYDNTYERRNGQWRVATLTLKIDWWKKVELETL